MNDVWRYQQSALGCSMERHLVRSAIFVASPFFLATSASADINRYRYDALGRLVESCVYGSETQDGRDTDIAYDKANNRNNYKSNLWGFRLNVGQQMFSPNGSYMLYMQTDGNFVLYGPTGPKWSSNTVSTGSFAKFQGDGNLVVYSSAGVGVWSSGTAGNPCARLQLQNDGNVVIMSGTDAVLWATNTYE